MDTNRLMVTIDATHQSLAQRLSEAQDQDGRRRARESYARMDALMAAASRHLAAVDEVVLPEVCRRLPDGKQRAKAYLVEARHLEQAVARLKARLYGEVHVVHLPLTVVWQEVRDQLTRHNQLELEMVQDLCAVSDSDACDDLATRIYRAELRAPTRAHPYTPHTGLPGLAARRLFAFADRFWDNAQSRVVPPPVRPRRQEPEHQSLLAQYLSGEPRLDAEAPVVNHHVRHRPAHGH
jgi:hypothetical protein